MLYLKILIKIWSVNLNPYGLKFKILFFVTVNGNYDSRLNIPI